MLCGKNLVIKPTLCITMYHLDVHLRHISLAGARVKGLVIVQSSFLCSNADHLGSNSHARGGEAPNHNVVEYSFITETHRISLENRQAKNGSRAVVEYLIFDFYIGIMGY